MEKGQGAAVLREIRALYTSGTLVGLTDAELLERFLARDGDSAEDAFVALMHRHGPIVLGACRRMLPRSHDAEDVFQATFLVLARRAASIGRREQLASWLFGVAVRIARDACRRAARQSAGERRLMEFSRIETEPALEPDDALPMLDEELNRLPRHFREALLLCELEGKSRREAAERLRIPEGTLSTRLARGRKRLRERLLRRGVTLGLGPIAGPRRPALDAAVLERLVAPTVRAATGSGPGAGATVSMLVERAIKMMFLPRLTLIAVPLVAAAASAFAAVVLSAAMGVAQPPQTIPKAGPDDLAGQVLDKSGAGVAGVQIWGMDGAWFTPDVVARATTDEKGRYLLRSVVHLITQPGQGRALKLFARAQDGRVGWSRPGWRQGDVSPNAEIELLAVGDARGRLTDQDGRPLAGVEIAPAMMSRSSTDFVWLSPEMRAVLKTATAADGSFVLKGVLPGDGGYAQVVANKFGAPMVSWDTSQAVTIALDSRLGRISGRLKPPDGGALDRTFLLGIHGPPKSPASPAKPFELFLSRDATTARDGTFAFDALPPGRYVVSAYFDDGGIVARQPETEVEVGPAAVAQIEIALQRLPMITGRVVDARTGNGVAGISLQTLWREVGRNLFVGKATTNAEGRYRIPARPGKNAVQITGLPKPYAIQSGAELPILQVEADKVVPDIKLIRSPALDGVVADGSGHPVAGAEVYFLTADRGAGGAAREPLKTGPDGTFHLDQLGPDPLLALWARAGDATTGDAVVVRPRAVKGKITLTVDLKNAVRIRGLAVDSGGRRVAGARVSLWWSRSDPVENGKEPTGSTGGMLATQTTGADGWFVFRNLWPQVDYRVVVEARGHNKAETPEVTGKAAETLDFGKVVLIDTNGRLAGRVVGSDGRPIAGAGVFNRGDAPDMIATSTDADGQFRLDGLLPSTRFAFVGKLGYRFTGIKVDDDADGLTITLKRSDEPPPAWKPGKSASPDEQRAFAKQVLIRVWEKFGADADNNGAFQCIWNMAEIDPDLAMKWSAERGHRYDDRVRQTEARNQAETDPVSALAILNQKPGSDNQSALQALAVRFAETDRKKALSFAEEAAVQSRGLNQPDRALAMAKAGALLVDLGSNGGPRKLIDEAARDALQLPTEQWAGNCRCQVARIVARFDLERALAIIQPFRADNERWQSLCADFAVAIATFDTKRALALVDTVGGPGFAHERARTAIAFQIGRVRPDEAIRIIEGIKRDRSAAEWQAGAFGWLAVALAPRDPARANALIDRALTMMIDNHDPIDDVDELAVAARIAACARRIGYPDMDSAILRVLAARPSEQQKSSGDQGQFIQRILKAAVTLALIDPAAARAVLEQVELRSGFDPETLPNTRQPWLIAWSLVDLRKAQAIFEADLAALDHEKEVRFWTTGIFEMVELLIAPPTHREAVLGTRSAGGYWRPEEPF